MSKDGDRARVERVLEDMMGDDWRVFRAKLVAQERENEALCSASLAFENEKKNHAGGGIGHFVAGAISSIFSPLFQDKRTYVSTMDENDHHNHEGFEFDMFTGENIERHLSSEYLKSLNDPFATEDEIVAINPSLSHAVQFDTHRWAHPLTHIEPGCVLVANETLGGVFHQTVVLIIDHHDSTGSTGICINRPLPGNLLKVASESNSNLDLNLKLTFSDASVSFGGPMMSADYSILHGYGEVEGSKKVAPGTFVGGSRSLMNEVRKNRFNPKDALFIKGHVAWIPKQLSREVSKGVWCVASVSPDFILRHAGNAAHENSNHAKDLWSDILTAMGGKYADIAKGHAGRRDLRMRP